MFRKSRIVLAVMLLAVTAPLTLVAQDAEDFDNSLTYAGSEAGVGPDFVPTGGWTMPTPSLNTDWIPNTVRKSVISAEAKMAAMQSMMMMNPFSLRDMMNMMVAKKKVIEGVSFDEVVESMDLRANLLNMMKVGHNTPHTVIAGITGEPTPRLEFLNYCDVMTMRDILDYVPEFAAFVPCRIAVMEDAVGDIWLMTLDWDVRWLDTSPNPNKISAELREKAIAVREATESIMQAGANGEL